eukprot:TRINITY_DN191_c0_g1_i3.p1 TRINITY_DN191_c0_g1~~TRINITY_DN191_c0_g1_i3.p1  ORF type:complete len:107 (+),score=10.99 TRINITY_DN191_c0_g1_i3:185-505(+)
MTPFTAGRLAGSQLLLWQYPNLSMPHLGYSCIGFPAPAFAAPLHHVAAGATCHPSSGASSSSMELNVHAVQALQQLSSHHTGSYVHSKSRHLGACHTISSFSILVF